MRQNPVYLYQLADWPAFSWKEEIVKPLIVTLNEKQAYLLGRMEGLGFAVQEEANLNVVTLDIVKSSEIEGEFLDPETVRSSVARRLGIEVAGLKPADRHVEGVVEMILDATVKHDEPVTKERLFSWQAALFPTGRSGLTTIITGNWRDNPAGQPMQVISGMMGREKVHFQAPDSSVVDDEMFAFLRWFNEEGDMNPFLKAAIAHLWFVTIHPFDDGNGRIARALTDLQLARADQTTFRFYSMSAQIRKEKNRYYNILEQTQKGKIDITAWICWFVECVTRAIDDSEKELQAVFSKAEFWRKNIKLAFNTRQKYMLNRVLDGYNGHITSSNWAKETKSSSDSAVRDINDLVEKGILVRGPEGGRSTRYLLVEKK